MDKLSKLCKWGHFVNAHGENINDEVIMKFSYLNDQFWIFSDVDNWTKCKFVSDLFSKKNDGCVYIKIIHTYMSLKLLINTDSKLSLCLSKVFGQFPF